MLLNSSALATGINKFKLPATKFQLLQKLLAKEMKSVVDNTSKYPDWSKRDDIKAKLKVELILLLHKHKFPPVANDDVYIGVLAQAENFKEHHMSALN
ncbi:DUF3387 domain-containing protein [Escherichia coli]|uniref:DUF3387 domain-containing protein n=1 Tax=Escherichia coli TaxID=562 RepID=A0A826P9U2_ECOLX|nr:DUF3387 domain-containing protein [Escherichia coli]EFA8285309.1 DUF3387 domain-containing protein [Escherichia coli O157]EFA8852123.1 DUF3387 domain-containing protein [Escherichia coli O177]EFZ75083.1 hsdR domain protein [Escherichia coli RN587/1]EYV93488.1 hypothetical protein BY41_13925 [Escherichia coli O86:H34 str. 99-3124]